MQKQLVIRFIWPPTFFLFLVRTHQSCVVGIEKQTKTKKDNISDHSILETINNLNLKKISFNWNNIY